MLICHKAPNNHIVVSTQRHHQYVCVLVILYCDTKSHDIATTSYLLVYSTNMTKNV